MHYVDRAIGRDEKLSAFEDLIRSGKVDYLGIVSEQHHYNLIDREAEREIIPCCNSHGIGLIVYSSVGGVLLGGQAGRKVEGTRSGTDYIREKAAQYKSKLDAYASLCD